MNSFKARIRDNATYSFPSESCSSVSAHLPTNAWRLLIPVTGKVMGLSCLAMLPRAPLTFVLVLPAAVATDAIFTGVGRGIRDGKTTPSLTGEFLAGLDLD